MVDVEMQFDLMLVDAVECFVAVVPLLDAFDRIQMIKLVDR
jgi:hypothetical protein